MAGAERTAEAHWEGSLFEGSGHVSLRSSRLAEDLPVTWASRTEAPQGKTSPEELIAAAHASCLSMALSNRLAQDGNAAESLDVNATSSFERTDAGFRLTKMHLDVKGRVPGLDDAGFRAAADAAKDGCPVSNALKGNVDITIEARLEG